LTLLAQGGNGRKIQQFTNEFTIGGILHTNASSKVLSLGNQMLTYYQDSQVQPQHLSVQTIDSKTFEILDGVRIEVRQGSADPNVVTKTFPVLRTETTGSAHESPGVFRFLNVQSPAFVDLTTFKEGYKNETIV